MVTTTRGLTYEVEVLLTPEDLAERWQLKVGSIYSMRSRGAGPKSRRVGGGAVRYRLADVEEYEVSPK